MQISKQNLILIGSVGLLFLGACNSENSASNSNNSPASPNPTVTSPTATSNSTPSPSTSTQTDHPNVSKGGQVVENGPYHLELVTLKETNGTHLDFYLQKGDTHEAIANATVTAQIQSPDGTQETIDFQYDSEGEHYAVLFPTTTSGQYQLKITADMNGEKVDGRFSFNQ